MESAGPRTRSRARHVDAGVPSSAAASTRKKAAPRSSRKSTASKTPPASPKPASREQNVPVEEADDTAATADIPETGAPLVDKAAPTPVEDMSSPSDAVDTIKAAPDTHNTPVPCAGIGGLTPVLPQSAAVTPGDLGYEPSPLQPVNLDSMWTLSTAQQGGNTPYSYSPDAATASAAAGGKGVSSTPGGNSVDLVSMFISTPAAPGSSSPVEGLVAAAASAEAELPCAEEEEQAGTAAAAAEPQPSPLAQQQTQQQMETPSANDSVLMGSPALPGTFAFAGLAASAGPAGGSSPAALPASANGSGAPAPSAPMLPSQAGSPWAGAGSSPAPPAAVAAGRSTPGTPGWNQDTPLPPTEATPGTAKTATLATAGRTPAGTTPGGASPMMTDDPDTPLLPATTPDFDEDQEYSVPSELNPLLSPLASPGSPLESTAAAGAAAGGKSPLSVQHRGIPAAAASGSPQPAMAAAVPEPEDTEMAAAGPQDAAERFEHALLQEAAAEVDLLAQQLQAVPTDSSGTERTSVELQQGHDDVMESEVAEVSMEPDAAQEEADEGAAMETSGFGSPAAAGAASPAAVAGIAGAAALAAATPKGTPAAAAAGVTSPGARYRSSSATTAAPPKSALAKPKSATSSVAPKHAHVVIPDAASPKTAPPGKATAGRKASAGPVPSSAAARFGHSQGHNNGSSPGHTPFPTKSKIRAATAAAERGASSTAAAAATAPGRSAAAIKAPTHKKEMALAAAHSALKAYSKAAGELDEVTFQGPPATAAVMGTPPSAGVGASRRSSISPSPTIPNVSGRLMQPTASSSAKARYSGASEGPDALMWSPPSSSEPAAASSPAAAGSSRPRMASKIVVPSPPPAAAAEPSLKALKRSIKSKVADKAQATVQEAQADRLTADAVRSSKELRATRKAAAAAVEDDLDLDMYDGDEEAGEQYDGQDVADLADSMAGLSVKPVNVAQPRGPLKGVAAPTGRHFRFDEAGNVQETPVSRQRRAPRHTKFDDEGNPLTEQPLPRWR